MQVIRSNSSFSFIFFSVIDVETAKSATSFLTFLAFGDIVAFLLISIVLDVTQVLGLIFIFFYYLGKIDLSDWKASSLAFMTSLFLGSLGPRLNISRKRIMGLSLVFILIPIPVLLTSFVFYFLG